MVHVQPEVELMKCPHCGKSTTTLQERIDAAREEYKRLTGRYPEDKAPHRAIWRRR